jgi:glycosyltransferase involved in cell wall biosynthesis
MRVGARRYAHLNRGIFAALSAWHGRRLTITGLYPSMLIALLWARATRTPVALHVDGDARHMPRSPYHRMARALVLSQVSAVVTSSRAGRRYFEAQGVAAERIVTMPIIPAWDGPNETRGFSDRPVDVLWVAELNDSVKNVGFFRDVVLALHRKRSDLRVRVVGDGPDAPALLNALRSAGIDFQHDTAIEWQRMAAVFGSAKLFALPSLHEPWGLVCHEAMQCGTPAIVSPMVGAAGELVDDGNGAVVPLSIDAWVRIIDMVLADSEQWARKSAAARAACAVRTIDEAVERYLDMLRLLSPATFSSRA